MKTAREPLRDALAPLVRVAGKSAGFRQADRLCFRDNGAFCFDGETFCSCLVPLDFTCAVDAKTLLETLRRSPDDELDVRLEGGVLTLAGGSSRRATLPVELEIELPVQCVETPASWSPLPAAFASALERVLPCVGKDPSYFVSTCVHFHPGWLEAFDGKRAARHLLPLGGQESFLVQKSACEILRRNPPSQWALTGRWVHFRTETGLRVSCLRYLGLEHYTEAVTKALRKGGVLLPLTREFAGACVRTKELAFGVVTVRVKNSVLTLEASGLTGRYEESLLASGADVEFRADPVALAELALEHDAVYVRSGTLLVDGGVWRQVLLLET